MKVSRGEFLTACGSGLLGATLNAQATSADLFDARDERWRIGADELRPHVGTAFQVRGSGRLAQQLVLTQVDDHTVDERIEQFSAVFQGAGDATLVDGTYQFQHPSLGQLDLFIVCVGAPGGGRGCYEACFSRISGWGRGDVLR